MNLMELKKEISDKVIKSLYIFTGEEIAVRNIYRKKLSDIFDGDTVFVDSLADVVPKLKTNSLISSKKHMFVLYDCTDVLTADKIWDDIKTGKFQKNHVMVFIFNTLDKRSKFYKEFSDYIVSFDLLSENVLVKYINKELKLSKDRAEDLVYVCQNNYNRILLEMDKIKSCAEYFNMSDDESFDYCWCSGMIFVPPDGEVFDLLNAILSRNVKETYAQLQKFMARGDSVLGILTLLHNNVKAVLQVQCANGLPNIGKVTGLNGYQIKNAMDFIDRYSDEELMRMLKLIRFCEESIKSTGLIDSSMVLDFLLVKLF